MAEQALALLEIDELAASISEEPDTIMDVVEPYLLQLGFLDRVNRELKRRTRVVGIFPNPDACLRLVTAIAIEICDEWFTNQSYLTIEPSSNK